MIQLTQNFVLIQEIERKQETSSGIILEGVEREPSTQGIVIHAGPEAKTVKIGGAVLFKRHGFEGVQIEGESYMLGKEDNIFAIIS